MDKKIPILLGFGLGSWALIRYFNGAPKGPCTPCKKEYDKALTSLKFVTLFHNPKKVFKQLRRDLLGSIEPEAHRSQRQSQNLLGPRYIKHLT